MSALPAGTVLRHTLKALGISQAELARRTGLSTKHISQVISGRASIGDACALAIGEATGIPAEVWIVLDAMHRMQLIAEPAIRAALTRPNPR